MKKHISIAFIALAAIISSCSKNYLDLRDNPNVPSVVTPNLLLSSSLKVSADIINGTYIDAASAPSTAFNPQRNLYAQYGCWVGFWSWGPTWQPNLNLETYTFTTADYNVWTGLYSNLSNYNALINLNAGTNYTAIAKIMTAYDFEQLVDNYGNVPYTQAFKGTGNLSPAYDDGSAIYDDLVKQLDAAITSIKPASTTDANPGTSDIVFGGDMTKWIKFGNTLKLRLAIRQWNKLPAKQAALKTSITATTALGFIDGSFHAAANPGYTNSDANFGQQSPFWLNYGSAQSGKAQDANTQYVANKYAVSFYKSTNDPRDSLFYASIANPTGPRPVTGIPFGQIGTSPVSQIGPGLLKSPTMDAIIMSSAEALFLQAEAVNYGLIPGSSATFYNQGIAASFLEAGVPDLPVGARAAAVATYLAQQSVAYPSASSPDIQLQAIITQKWAALNGYGNFEAYNEYRRTGYPLNIPLSITPGSIAPNNPTRILYPDIEFSTNATNVGLQPVVNKFTSKIFWAK